MRLRQFVFVARDLAPAVEEIGAVLGLAVCFRDPGVGKFGLENALLPINGNFLEVVAPMREGTTAGRYLERRGGDGGYMIILQCADAQHERERIAALGVREIWRHDSDTTTATHYHPADVPGAILSIDTMYAGSHFHREHADWRWAGPDWTEYLRTERTQALTAIDIQAENPGSFAERWSRVLDLPSRETSRGHEIGLDNAMLRFVEPRDARGPGIASIDILPQDRRAIVAAAEARGLRRGEDRIELCGVGVNLV